MSDLMLHKNAVGIILLVKINVAIDKDYCALDDSLWTCVNILDSAHTRGCKV